MRIETVEIESAVGGILVHNLADAQGHKAFAKGHVLSPADVSKLRALGKSRVTIARLDAGDVAENDAAARIAAAVAGEHISLLPAGGGRVNLAAAVRGICKVNDRLLWHINSLKGVTLATIPANRLVAAKKMVATVKTIGLALPLPTVEEVERIGREAGGVISIRPLRAARVALVLTGSPEARERVETTFRAAIHSRIEELGSRIIAYEYVEHDTQSVAAAIGRAKQSGVDCMILAGETSIMDESDVTPSAIRLAGGEIEVYGAPVEPGNLMLLAYANALPILGAPGCVKSRETNVVDLILPRLLSGERVTRADVIALANGGLLI